MGAAGGERKSERERMYVNVRVSCCDCECDCVCFCVSLCVCVSVGMRGWVGWKVHLPVVSSDMLTRGVERKGEIGRATVCACI